METKHVYQAISAVTAAIAREGISKTHMNKQQGYEFRGIDDIYNALASILAEHKLCILPRVTDRQVSERAMKSGVIMTYTILTVEFDLVSAVDGSSHVIRTVGEAMDSADKSSNKAQSAAMKYACLMAFQIPTEGDNDTENSHHEKRTPLQSDRAPAPSLETQLSDSVVMGEWEHSWRRGLSTAASLGELQEHWLEVTEQAKARRYPRAVVDRLAVIKDARKVALQTRSGEAA